MTMKPQRYATLPNIMKAKKKKLDVLTAEELGVDLKSNVHLVSVREPLKRVGGSKVPDVDTLLAKMKL